MDGYAHPGCGREHIARAPRRFKVRPGSATSSSALVSRTKAVTATRICAPALLRRYRRTSRCTSPPRLRPLAKLFRKLIDESEQAPPVEFMADSGSDERAHVVVGRGSEILDEVLREAYGELSHANYPIRVVSPGPARMTSAGASRRSLTNRRIRATARARVRTRVRTGMRTGVRAGTCTRAGWELPVVAASAKPPAGQSHDSCQRLITPKFMKPDPQNASRATRPPGQLRLDDGRQRPCFY